MILGSKGRPIVELTDGSWVAHMAKADMRIPILHALCYPNRREAMRGPKQCR